jgi:CheY-like chemotaxis protein
MEDLHILYVEDDELSCEVMEALLTRGLGYKNFTVFENSREFMQRLQALSTKPDIIFLDIHMEPFDGFEMLRQVRKDQNFDTTKIVAFTASVMNEEVKLLREAGFDGVFAKPLAVEAFPSALHRILNGEQLWIIK